MDDMKKDDLKQLLLEPIQFRDGTVCSQYTGEYVPYFTPENFAILYREFLELKGILIEIIED